MNGSASGQLLFEVRLVQVARHERIEAMLDQRVRCCSPESLGVDPVVVGTGRVLVVVRLVGMSALALLDVLFLAEVLRGCPGREVGRVHSDRCQCFEGLGRHRGEHEALHEPRHAVADAVDGEARCEELLELLELLAHRVVADRVRQPMLGLGVEPHSGVGRQTRQHRADVRDAVAAAAHGAQHDGGQHRPRPQPRRRAGFRRERMLDRGCHGESVHRRFGVADVLMRRRDRSAGLAGVVTGQLAQLVAAHVFRRVEHAQVGLAQGALPPRAIKR